MTRYERLSKACLSWERRIARRLPLLTPREVTVCAMIYVGLSAKEASRGLGVSTRTIENHCHRLRKRLNLEGNTRTALLRLVGGDA